MGLMTGSGPLGRQPAGVFNFEPPEPGRALYLEPSPKRVRAELAGETIADSRNVLMLQEGGLQPTYYFPARDVRSDLLEPSDRVTHCPKKGDASYYTVRVGDRVEEAVAWYYPAPLAGAAGLKDMIAFSWNRIDHWYEEAEEVVGHPRDPYHRVDVIQSDRVVRVSLGGVALAESSRPVALFESNLPTRWYLPREDVTAELTESGTVTRCPYKGTASYYSVSGIDGGDDVVWYYEDPLPEVAKIKDLLCFFNERVDLELDGEAWERPDSPWSQRVKSDPPAARTGS
jgi:uncharacterized protein (DUF427 family)